MSEILDSLKSQQVNVHKLLVSNEEKNYLRLLETSAEIATDALSNIPHTANYLHFVSS